MAVPKVCSPALLGPPPAMPHLEVLPDEVAEAQQHVLELQQMMEATADPEILKTKF